MAEELPSISDEELARETQAGSLAAFEQLVYRYEHRIYAFIFQFCRNPTDAREATQDTFVKAFQNIGRFDTRRVFAPWLFTIARRICIDRHRAAPVIADSQIPELPEIPDPSQVAARREAGQDLWRLARQHLKTNQYQALWLHYVEDLDVAQIAQTLGKTKVHVKVMLFRARQILGRELKSNAACGEPISRINSKTDHALAEKRPSAFLESKLLAKEKII
ncbi:MAG TPA: sigma-70 family RNA polymerase sigma factor [Verrucomicrobiae bacterium]|nr:sigma-70 family RNA polymerase sigma factor [Verrucomicrobiae bacterium]